MWQQNLGISVELENMDWKVYLSRQNAMDYQISRAGWIGDYEDPNTFLDIMRTGRGNNRTCLLYTSPSPRDLRKSRMPSSA